jgi:sugar/nucleoside kinase (ribokinase family)
MSTRRGIVAAGNWIIDHVKVIDHLPEEEHLANILTQTRGTGGAPYNVLVNLATLDPSLPLKAIGVVGSDPDGAFILDHLRQLGIDSKGMRSTSEAPTSYTDVMTVQSTGRRTFFHHRGANRHLGPADFDFRGSSARLFHLGYLMLLDALDAPDDSGQGTKVVGVLESARAAGLRTSVDMVTNLGPGLREIVVPALKQTDYFILNEIEAGALAGIAARDREGTLIAANLPGIADRILAFGVQRLVVIHAPEGAFWQEPAEPGFFHPSLNVPSGWIRGTAGAGDAFCAGILYGLHEDWSAQESLRLAVANAAQSLNHPTCTGSLRPLQDTMKLVEEFGFR